MQLENAANLVAVDSRQLRHPIIRAEAEMDVAFRAADFADFYHYLELYVSIRARLQAQFVRADGKVIVAAAGTREALCRWKEQCEKQTNIIERM